MTYSVGNRLESSDIDTFIIGTIFNEGENIVPDAYDEDTLPRKTDDGDLEQHMSEYDLDRVLVNLEETDRAEDGFTMYENGHPLWDATMVPDEQFDAIMYFDRIDE